LESKPKDFVEVENQKGNMKQNKTSSILERIAKVLDPLCRICKVCFDLYVMVHGR